ncbi:MAG: TIM barrel protein [Verrucomicrobiota bacterium]|nr:TIM barrel protein [Verrucomicrobiota bacterium]
MKSSSMDFSLSRRAFTSSMIGLTSVSLKGLSKKDEKKKRLLLGFDNFSIRALGWKAPRLVEYATKNKVDALLFSDLDVYESFDHGYLREIGQEVKKQKIILHAGTGGICQTSKSFKDKHGTAEEHLRLLIKVTKSLGSSVARCYLGSSKDRKTEGGIRKHMDNTIKTLKKVRTQAMDAGVKIAVENHAGDMHSRELVQLIEQAGPEFVGATIDTGNSTWTLEDPVETFRNLAPYAVCSGIRDSMIWQSDKGAKVQWTAMGDGCVDLQTLFKEWSDACPETPVQIETISGFAKEFPYLEKDFWPPYSTIRADDYSCFLALARKGKTLAPFSAPDGVDKKKAQQDYQLTELEKSFVYCRENLGIGRKSA